MIRFLLIMVMVGAGLLALPVRAQVHGGIKGGINVSGLDHADFRPTSYNSSTYSARVSGHGGVYLTAWLGEHLAVQTEVLYSEQGTKFSRTVLGTTTTVDSLLRMQVLSIPILLKLYLLNKHLYLEAGPQFGLLLAATQRPQSSTAQAATQDVKQQYKAGDYAMAAGVGAEVGRLTVGVRYIYGLSYIYSAQPIRNMVEGPVDFRQRVAQASVGFRIF